MQLNAYLWHFCPQPPLPSVPSFLPLIVACKLIIFLLQNEWTGNVLQTVWVQQLAGCCLIFDFSILFVTMESFEYECSYGYVDQFLTNVNGFLRCRMRFETQRGLRIHQTQWCTFREMSQNQTQIISTASMLSKSSQSSTQILSQSSVTPPRQVSMIVLTATPNWYEICFNFIGLTIFRNESPILLPLEDIIQTNELINFQQQIIQQQPNPHATGLQSQGPHTHESHVTSVTLPLVHTALFTHARPTT